jgi:hypothetical protein
LQEKLNVLKAEIEIMKAMASRILWATWGLVAFGADSTVVGRVFLNNLDIDIQISNYG